MAFIEKQHFGKHTDFHAESEVHSVNFSERWNNLVSYDFDDIVDEFDTDTVEYREVFKTREVQLAQREENAEKAQAIQEIIAYAKIQNVDIEQEIKQFPSMTHAEVLMRVSNIKRMVYAYKQTDIAMSWIKTIYDAYQHVNEYITYPRLRNFLDKVMVNFGNNTDRTKTILRKIFYESYNEEENKEETAASMTIDLVRELVMSAGIELIIPSGPSKTSFKNDITSATQLEY